MNFFVIGNDKRSVKLKELYLIEGSIAEDIIDSDAIICPIPFSKDRKYLLDTDILIEDYIKRYKDKILFTGAIPNEIKNRLLEENIKFYDLMELERVAILNAIPTAEGAMQKAMEYMDITLFGSNALVLGYGRIGKILAKVLSAMGVNVFCEARNEKDLALIKAMGYNEINLKELDRYLLSFDVIFNTIPYMVLYSDRLDKLKKTCVVIDLASNPGGTDFQYASDVGLRASLELALPSRVAPTSAAIYIKEAIDNIVNNKK